jgi:O-antigen/teichoic acid export membrane protein
MDVNGIKNRMAKDTLLYLPAKVIEGVIGIFTITVYTKYLFTTSIFGYYNIISTSTNIACLLLLGWLIQSSFRYVNTFNSGRKLKLFYSTSFTAWATINGTILAAGLITTAIMAYFTERWIVELVLASMFMFMAYNTAQILFSLLGAIRRIKLNLVMAVLSVTAKLILTIILIYTFKSNKVSPIGAVISNAIVDSIVSAVIVIRLGLYKHVSFKLFSRKIFRKFMDYGIPIMGVSLTMSLLNLSDRFVIIFSLGSKRGAEQAGIYAANYSIASAVFSMILMAVMRGVYPMILKTWRQSNKEQTEMLLSQAVRYFLLVSVPVAIGLSVLSSTIARLLLGKDFYQGWFVMIFVSVGMLFLGLTEYSNKAWELTSKTKVVLKNSFISGLTNLAINIAFIPFYGYKIAAISTALSYVLYFILSITGSRKVLKWRLPIINYARIIGSGALMGAILLLIIFLKQPTLLSLLWLVPFGAAVYGGCLYITKEVEPEIKHVAGWLKNRKKIAKV